MTLYRSVDENALERDEDDYIRAFEAFYAKRLGHDDLSSLSDAERERIERQARAALLEDLYKNLDSIDGKASALLNFCGLVIASITILISLQHLQKYVILLYIAFASAVLSAFIGVTVIHVHWSSAKRLEGRSLRTACRNYYRTRLNRTARYLLAWKLVLLTIGVLGCYILLDVVFRVFQMVPS